MASQNFTNLLFRIFMICIALDVASRYFEKPNPSLLAKKAKPQKEEENKYEDKYEDPLKDVDIDTSLDEDDDDDNFVDKHKKKPKKKSTNETQTEDDDKSEETKEEAKGEKKTEKKVKKNKKKKNDDEDYEDEEPKEILTIHYDKKSFQKYYDNLKNQIMGNFTYLDVEEKEYPLPPFKKFFSKFTFFTQISISFLIFGGQKYKDKLTMIPPGVFDTLEKNKWVVMIGNFLLHQWLNRYLSSTGAFEVYYKGKLIFSKLASNRLPSELDLHRQLKKLVKKRKSKQKSKHTKKEDDDNDDDEL
jgi:selT/selW/selH-like putative selenoprotein